MIKEHKVTKPGQLPKTRPVVSSQNDMNCKLSYIISEILEPMAETAETSIEVISSEGLLKKETI